MSDAVTKDFNQKVKEFNDRERARRQLQADACKPATELERQLLVAAEMGDAPKVTELIKKGANIFVNNEEPLLLAARNGHLEAVKLLVAAGSVGDTGYSVAKFAALGKGYTEIAKVLGYVAPDQTNQSKPPKAG